MKKPEKFWNRMAKSYDREEEKDKPSYIEIIKRTRKHLKPTDILLDFGCGTGNASNDLSSNVMSIHGIDISENMINISKEKAIKQQNKNIEYSTTDIFDNSIQPNTYDVVIALYILHLVEDPSQVLNRINELLKPGGVFISVTPCMKERKAINLLLKTIGVTGLVPKITSLNNSELLDLISNSNFKIDEVTPLDKKSLEYFAVAYKKEL